MALHVAADTAIVVYAVNVHIARRLLQKERERGARQLEELDGAPASRPVPKMQRSGGHTPANAGRHAHGAAASVGLEQKDERRAKHRKKLGRRPAARPLRRRDDAGGGAHATAALPLSTSAVAHTAPLLSFTISSRALISMVVERGMYLVSTSREHCRESNFRGIVFDQFEQCSANPFAAKAITPFQR